jgi:serralysin
MTEDRNHWHCAYCEELPGSDTAAVRLVGRAALLNRTHWGDYRDLTVGFMGGDADLRARVAQIAQEWSDAAKGGIRFSFWLGMDLDPRPADIRVAFLPGRGSWSYLGTDALSIADDQPTMNFGWLTPDLPDEEFRAVVLHEFGHALGLIHEHQNPHKAVKWNVAAVTADLAGQPNNWDEDTIRNNMFRRYEKDDLFATEVDPVSVMMYPIPQNWTEDDFQVLLSSSVLSANDRALIAAAYPPLD